MKNWRVLILSIIYLLLINGSALWERLPFMYELVAFVILNFVCYYALAFFFIVMVLQAVRNGDEGRKSLPSIAMVGCVLVLVFFFPTGFFDFHEFNDGDFLEAQHEGGANCITNLTFESNNRMEERTYCFGTDARKGRYQIENDTIYIQFINALNSNDDHCFGIVELNQNKLESESIGIFYYYDSTEDETPLPMNIINYNPKF